MKSRVRRNSARPISKSRWVAYATASAAATLVSTQQAAAEIHYSGRVDVEFPNGDPDDVTERAFPLDQPVDSIVFIHSNQHFLGSPFAGVRVEGIVSAGFRGPVGFDYYYVARIPKGRYISQGHFTSDVPSFGTLGQFGLPKEWNAPGTDYVGFRFNNGAGRQYGWARVFMTGADGGYAFKVLDYAYADPGEPIQAGQRRSRDEAAPDLGSLGLLAVGAAGVAVWRKRTQRPTQEK